jgi:Tfp pilus assembly protein PilF
LAKSNLTAAYFNRGVGRFRKGDIDQAITDLTEVIRLDPNSAVSYMSRAGAYKRKNDYDRVIADLTEAIRLDPNGADAWYERGRTYQFKEEKIADKKFMLSFKVQCQKTARHD